MKNLLFLLGVSIFVFSSCIKDLEKEDIFSQTIVKGKVLEENNNIPVTNLRIKLTDGKDFPKTGYTNQNGEFEITVTNDQISKGYYLLIGADSVYSDIKIELKEINFGKKFFDFGIIYVKGAELPTVKTISATNIAVQVIECKGEVRSEGKSHVFQRGFCVSENPHPTLADNAVNLGSGIGEFSTTLQGLKLNTIYYVRAFAINSVGVAYGEEISLKTLDGSPTVDIEEITNITSKNASIKANAISDGGFFITERGFCYSISPNPTMQNTSTSCGANTGEFYSTLQNLYPNTLYYIRAFAKNSAGVGYSEQRTFTTLSGLPIVTTKAVSNITSSSAQCGGNISSDGGFSITKRGICYSTSPNPTINNTHTSDGTGTGSFISYLSNLQSHTTYYIRAYATNAIGTTYGEEISFITE